MIGSSGPRNFWQRWSGCKGAATPIGHTLSFGEFSLRPTCILARPSHRYFVRRGQYIISIYIMLTYIGLMYFWQ